MTHPKIGWEREDPVPNHTFNDYLSARGGRLYFEELDLAGLFLDEADPSGVGTALESPLEIVYLPKIRQKIRILKDTFARAIQKRDYEGDFHYVYASKANAAAEVVRTVLGAGAHYEISSAVDVDIASLMIEEGLLKPSTMVICNGFKTQGTHYAQAILRLKRRHPNLIPVVEDLTELPPLLESDQSFDVGLRQKSYGEHTSLTEMEGANSRFGMRLGDLMEAAERIAEAPNLRLRLYHAMVGSQIVPPDEFVARLKPPMEVYARLRARYDTLRLFDFGGGVPVPMTLNFRFDYLAFAEGLLAALRAACGKAGVPVPDVIAECGRYTVAEHGAHLFEVLTAKENGSALPWYIVDGSIMTSFPDVWALGEHFTVLPLNHLDKPFQRVQIGGITCDSDDVYPPETSPSPLYLPVEVDKLHIGFFGIGAYQEMLGGVGGSKHCVIPEADELIIDRDGQGAYQFQRIEGQGPREVLRNLGYRFP